MSKNKEGRVRLPDFWTTRQTAFMQLCGVFSATNSFFYLGVYYLGLDNGTKILKVPSESSIQGH